MHYSQEYANDPRNGYACAPTESGHAPAYHHGGELRQQRGNQPFHYVQSQSQSPTAQRVPMRINATPGYFYSGCWYNAGLQKTPAALVQQPEVQPALAPPQLQQQQQHVPQFYMPPQHEQQLEHAAPSYPSQQQHIFYPLQPQGQNRPLFYPSQQQVQVMPLTYPSQQQEQVSPSCFPSQQQQVQVLPLSYPSQQQQQVLPLSYQSQQQEQAVPSYLTQQGQVMPPPYPSQQQVLPPSYPLQQQQQVMPPYQTYSSEPVPQYQVIPQVVPQVMQKAMPTLPVIMEETDGPENQESQESQVLEATEAQETIKVPPQLVEICLGPGVQVTRSQDKLTIDIGLSNAVTEKQGSLKDMFCKLFQMIKRYAFSSRVARARRNRLRHLVTKKRSFKASSSCDPQMTNDNAEKSTLMEDKDTQTFGPDPVPIQLEVLSSLAAELEEIPLPEDPIPELADSVFEVQSLPLIPLPGTLISEEHSSIEPQPISKVDLIGKQDSAHEYFPDPGQQREIAQPMGTPEPVYFPEEKILQPMISPCLELIGKALIPPPPPPPLPLPLPLPEVFEELKEPIVDSTYWPPLGSRPPTKASKAKQQLTPEKSKEDSPKQQPSKFHRFNENRFMGSSSGGLSHARMRILRKLERCESHSRKIEVEVPKVPAADVQDSYQNQQSPRNDKKIQKSPQKSQQNQKPSVQNSKRNQSEPQAVARNMFALLEQLVEEPSPEISAEVKNQKADARQEKDKREARKTKKLKRRLKKKERAQRIQLEAKEKAAKAAKEAMEEAIKNVKDIPIPDTPSLLKPKLNLQDMIPKPQRVPTKPTIDKAPKEAPAGEGKPIAKKPETGEKDQVASLVASLKNPRRLRLRSPFLEAVATAHKSHKETLLSRKRKLWEKRKSDV